MTHPSHLPVSLSILQEVFGYGAFRGAQDANGVDQFIVRKLAAQ